MEKNARTTLTLLQPGDRFYFLNDKNKEVWTLQPFSKGKTWKQGNKVFHADFELKNDANQKKFSKGATQVVFLRSTVNGNEPINA